MSLKLSELGDFQFKFKIPYNGINPFSTPLTRTTTNAHLISSLSVNGGNNPYANFPLKFRTPETRNHRSRIR